MPVRRAAPKATKRVPVGIQSVETAHGVLQAMIRSGGAASLGELSRAVGLQPSKLHRYLVSLVRCGLATQSPVSGRYDLGLAARQLGAAAFGRFDGFGPVGDCVGAIAAATGHTTLLYVWTEQGATLIRLQDGIRPLAMTLRIGSTVPLRRSGAGRVFLAYLPEAVTEPLARLEAEAGEHPGALDDISRATLAGIRADGHFWTASSVLPGSEILAVPVFEAQHRLHSVIGVAVPHRAMTQELRATLITRVRRLVAAVSVELGDTEPGLPPG